MSSGVPGELSSSVSKLVDLTKQLAEARADIKILNQEEKRLKQLVQKLMVSQGIDTINLRKGKINIRHVTRKGSMTKAAVTEGLKTFFGGDEVKVEGALNAIRDGIKSTQATSLSLCGIKDTPAKEQ
jgi:adenine-specific DNA methylase